MVDSRADADTLTEQAKRLHVAETLLSVSRTVSAMETLDEALTTLVEMTVRETGADRGSLFLNDASTGELYSRVAPLALSRLVIDNRFDTDLEESLWDGDATTRQITEAGRRLDALDLLPAPFPLQEMLSEKDFRHVLRLYGIGGLSYGNVSARHDAERFWMSASGVDKSDMRLVGEHIQMVKGFDAEQRAIRLSVPPPASPRTCTPRWPCPRRRACGWCRPSCSRSTARSSTTTCSASARARRASRTSSPTPS